MTHSNEVHISARVTTQEMAMDREIRDSEMKQVWVPNSGEETEDDRRDMRAVFGWEGIWRRRKKSGRHIGNSELNH